MLKFAQPQLDEDTIQAVAAVLRSNWIATGPNVTELEHALSESFGARPTRVLTSATGAMEIALQVCGIGPGDEVITSAQTFFSAMNMIVKVGATPVFVDCELHTRAIDLAQVEAAITPRTRAIMPTHFPGALGDIDALYALARRHQLRVIEDAALVQGSYWKDQPVGGFGDIAVFSFHPNKNMTTIEGGAIVVASEDEAKLVDLLRFHGIKRLPDDTRDVAIAAGKFNMSDVSAVIGVHQLKQLPRFLAQRATLVERYFEKFPPVPGVVLPPQGVPRQSWNMFNVLIPYEQFGLTRQSFRAALQAQGVGTGMSYEACHLTTVGRGYGYTEGQFPNAERIARETVTLPLHAAMTLEEVDHVCAVVAQVLKY
ncbi:MULTISPECIES: DegT/DnrJ/EryC1/StrS aminotransferase family protein [unclassified Duganella]|uniref:DegT/DnrJ/EryC1/StrS family aminotransferase n=1 Tax=unclassified Duganella TaxID=2636909 RepID=UPI000E34A3F1|nr:MULTISPECIES: DegT/DnrJ/EryC1/StrS aminotransferase family protein [unclassified Duganella]RFP09493.1 DegT/DnrJ/EryC1/StrS aminotransferase family protein [Duganella sp. BJB475]RFP27613.1 DegT/DnrJ/EryC1/StrS aminotransferase family protein [Duganella sp. BJB476]